jgi:5'-nucleotidase
VQPFGNNLVVMSLNGAEIKTLLENQQPPRRDAPLFLSPSAGLSYRWLAKAAHGQRVQDLMLDGQPLLPDRDYRLTVNNFMADGGDGFSGLSAGRQRLGGAQDLDALVDLLQTGPALVATPRIEWVE